MKSRFSTLLICFAIFTLGSLPATAATPADCDQSAAISLAADNPFVPGGELLPSEPRPLAPDCHGCISGFSSSVGGGASHTGSGVDCAAATANLRAQLLAYADAECAVESQYGKCTFRVIHTSGCYTGQNGQQAINGYTNFSCWMPVC